MEQSEILYRQTGQALTGVTESQLFGKPCFKINGKAFICFFRDCMVFKLRGPEHTAALALDGAVLFDPSDKGRPMKEWVQVPFTYKNQWVKLAKAALDYARAAA